MEKINDDQTLEGGAGEALEPELEPAQSEDITEDAGGSGDPLDDIKDEVARAEAKRIRAIARRNAKKGETKEEAPKAPASGEFLTKADFEKSNERKAIFEVTKDPEVKANWNEIRAFYTPRRGKATPEDIQEDIRDAITLYNFRKGETVEKPNPAADLQVTAAPVGVASSGEKTKEPAKNPPGFRLPTKPTEWYGKKS